MLWPAATEARPYHYKWMGELSCGAWPKELKYNHPEKGALLNWVLGYLGRAQQARALGWFDDIDPASISAWMDNYCQANPLDSVVQGTMKLEAELVARSSR